nr:MAG TPA: hypothetical protein [Caudoviricetes sp.]
MEVKGFCPRDYMKLLTGFPLYFHTIILPLFFFPGVASYFFYFFYEVILTSIPLQPG